jgi:plasmid stability protein
MSQLMIPDVAESLLQQLQQRAVRHGRSIEAEARVILEDALRPDPAKVWAEVDAIRERLAATGRDFGDSVQDIREDRER